MTVLRAGILILLTNLLGGGLVLAADTTPPTVPGQPREGTTISRDEDYDADGRYMVFWSTSVDRESGVTSYEVQEQTGASGPWIRVATSRTPRVSVSRRRHGLRYAYRVRAQNRARLWSPWSAASDGITVDLTPPTEVTVTDDGATTSDATLHATWTQASDRESGITHYEYLIREDSTSGPIIKNWTSAGLTTEVTVSNLSLLNGKTYFIGVRAKNGAGRYAAARYSDGILVQPRDTTPPTGTIRINGGVAYTTTPSVTLTLSATDDSGSVTQMRCSSDGVTYASPEPFVPNRTWTLPSGDGPKTVYVQFSDQSGNWSPAVSDDIVLDTRAPMVVIVYPQNGALLGARSP